MHVPLSSSLLQGRGCQAVLASICCTTSPLKQQQPSSSLLFSAAQRCLVSARSHQCSETGRQKPVPQAVVLPKKSQSIAPTLQRFSSWKGSWELKILSHFFHTELERGVYGEWMCASPNLCLCPQQSSTWCPSYQCLESSNTESSSSKKSEHGHTVQSSLSLPLGEAKSRRFLPTVVHGTKEDYGECHEFSYRV